MFVSIQIINSAIKALVETVAKFVGELVLIEFVFKLVKWRIVGKVVALPVEVVLQTLLIEGFFLLVTFVIAKGEDLINVIEFHIIILFCGYSFVCFNVQISFFFRFVATVFAHFLKAKAK